MNLLSLCLSIVVGVAAAGRRVPRQYQYQHGSFGDYGVQLPIHAVGFAPEPIPYQHQPQGYLTATCKLVPASGQHVGGDIVFQQAASGGPVEVTGVVHGLTPGFHGFHIHQNGNLSDNCKAAGPHFNPAMAKHGAPSDEVRHAGDLGNIEADESGVSNVHAVDKEISLEDGHQRLILGRAVVVHAKQDDLGRGRDAESSKTGNAGSRVACCIIEAGGPGKK